jgi:hypothetical protein
MGKGKGCRTSKLSINGAPINNTKENVVQKDPRKTRLDELKARAMKSHMLHPNMISIPPISGVQFNMQGPPYKTNIYFHLCKNIGPLRHHVLNAHKNLIVHYTIIYEFLGLYPSLRVKSIYD